MPEESRRRYADAHLICLDCQHVYPVPEALLPQYAALIEDREVPETPLGVDGSCPRCHPVKAGMLVWLRSTIEGDKAAAEAATPGPWTVDAPSDGEGGLEIESVDALIAGHGHYGGGVWKRADADHIALHDPRDTIARCEAELDILDWHTGAHECSGPNDNCMWVMGGDDYCPTVRALARGYRYREGFEAEWLSGSS